MFPIKLGFLFFCVAYAAQLHEYQSFDGTNNNLKNPEYGLPNRPCIRVGKANYANGVDEMVMTPNARTVSNALFELSLNSTPELSKIKVNELHAMFRMFVMLDVFNIESANNSAQELVNVSVDKGDPYLDKAATGTQTIPYQRSNFQMSNNSRIPVNINSGFLDGSSVYGQSKEISDSLRTMKDGLLRVNDDNTLPFNVDGINIAMENVNISPGIPPLSPASRLRASGTPFVNYTPETLMVHTLFVREHNRLAAQYAAANPDWDDETLFQEARRWNIALIQRITDREFLAPILGKPVFPPYSGYNADIDPMVTNFFASVAFKYSHSQLNEIALRIGNNYLEVKEQHIVRRDAFYNPDKAFEAGIEPLFSGLVSQRVKEVSPFTGPTYRNFLNSNPAGSIGLDQAFLDIMRARDHGVPFYNDCRRFYNLEPYANFSFVANKDLEETLTKLYGTPETADAMVVAMAEPRMDGASVGELIGASLFDQFRRIRDGDRFWYANPGVFTPEDLAVLQRNSLIFVLLANLKNVTNPLMYIGFFDESELLQAAQPPADFPLSTEYYPESYMMSNDYKLSWKVNDDTQEIEFLAQARSSVSLGWLGVGFIPNSVNSIGGGMMGCDITMGSIKDDGPYVRDYFAENFGDPQLDTELGGTDNLKDASFYTVGEYAILKFTKPIKAVDEKYDMTFGADEEIRVIFAMGNSFTIPSYHAYIKGWQILKINKVVISMAQSYGPWLIAISALISVVVLVFFVLVIKHRNNVVIKASGWKFSLIVLVGLLFCLMTVVVNVTLPSVAVCTSRRVLLPLGLSTIFASLAVTQWRLHKIFNAIGVKRVIGLTDVHLFSLTSLGLVGNIVIIIIWSFISPVSLIENRTEAGLITLSCSGLNDLPFVLIIYIYNALIILTATVFAYFNRNLISTFNETSIIGNVVYNSVAVTFLMVLVNTISQMAEEASDILNSIAILYGVIFALALLFAKKIWRVYHPLIEKKSAFLSDSNQSQQKASHNTSGVSGVEIGGANTAGNSVAIAATNKVTAIPKTSLKGKAIMNDEKEIYVYAFSDYKILLIQDAKTQTTKAFTNQEINCTYDTVEVEAPETTLLVKIGLESFSLRFHDAKTSRKWKEFLFESFGKQGISNGVEV